MIIGTWNLEVKPSRHSSHGIAVAQEIQLHAVDVWFFTEIHADWEVDGHSIFFSPAGEVATNTRRSAAISSSWQMEPILGPNTLVEEWICMARLNNPNNNETILAVSTVLPWRGITPYWRQALTKQTTFADAFRHVLQYIVQRINTERRPGENVIWGGDFNQALSGRDYVGTNQGRRDFQKALQNLELWAPTADMPALIPAHPAIDHIAIPSAWSIKDEPLILRPTRNQKNLSDHALYVIDAALIDGTF